jgi:uncharacterized protein
VNHRRIPRNVILLAASILLIAWRSPESDFQKAVEANTEQAYAEFIQQHPDTPQAAQAQARLEKVVYSITIKEDTIESYEAFLNRFPNSQFAKDLLTLLYSKYEERGWSQAVLEDKQEAYKIFHTKYPTSRHLLKITGTLRLKADNSGFVIFSSDPDEKDAGSALDVTVDELPDYHVKLGPESAVKLQLGRIFRHPGSPASVKPRFSSSKATILIVRNMTDTASTNKSLGKIVLREFAANDTRVLDAVKDGIYAVGAALADGANINAKTQNGVTALMIAARSSSTELVKFLLENGADVNAQSDDGYTAILLAVTNGDAGVTKLLIENGADVNAKSNDGFTALFLAQVKGDSAIMQLLTQAGAK